MNFKNKPLLKYAGFALLGWFVLDFFFGDWGRYKSYQAGDPELDVSRLERVTFTMTNGDRSPPRQCAFYKEHYQDRDTNLDDEFLIEDGVATDLRDNLVWMRCSVGQRYQNGTCEGDPQLLHFSAIPKNLEMANAGRHPAIGKTKRYKWRLPTKSEFRTILYVPGCGGRTPDINTNVFPNHMGATETAPYHAWSHETNREKMLRRNPESLGHSKDGINFGGCKSDMNPGCHGGVWVGYIRFVADPIN